MASRLQQALGDRVDLLVVGGGIYGACLAGRAAARGLSVALVEAADFAGGTSGQSLRILHGGLRYLQHVDFRRMRESIRARRDWMRRFPGLVAPQAFSLPSFGHGVRGKEALTVALKLNDLASWDRNSGLVPEQHLPPGRVVSRGRAEEMYARFNVAGFNGAAIWYDGLSLDSERLVIRLLSDAARLGAKIANRAKARKILFANGRVSGVAIEDRTDGESHDLAAERVITVVGPWTGDLLRRSDLPAAASGEFSLAMNLVLRDLPVEHGIGVPVQRQGTDKDALVSSGQNTHFLVPWQGHTLAGTRHFSIKRDDATRETLAQCADRFFGEVRGLLRDPSMLEDDQRVAVLSGWLPEAGEVRPDRDPVLEKHPRIVEHSTSGASGLTTVVGVKWTTADVVACQLLDRVFPGSTETGTEATEISEPLSTDASMNEPLLDAFPLTRAEVVRQVRHEWVVELSDVVLRRNPLWLQPGLDKKTLGKLAGWVASELRWSAEETESQLARTRDALSRRRGPRALEKGEPV